MSDAVQTHPELLRQFAEDLRGGYGAGDWSLGWTATIALLTECADIIEEHPAELDSARRSALEQAATVPDLVVDEYDGKTSGWGYSEQWSGFTDAAERIERKILTLVEGCA